MIYHKRSSGRPLTRLGLRTVRRRRVRLPTAPPHFLPPSHLSGLVGDLRRMSAVACYESARYVSLDSGVVQISVGFSHLARMPLQSPLPSPTDSIRRSTLGCFTNLLHAGRVLPVMHMHKGTGIPPCRAALDINDVRGLSGTDQENDKGRVTLEPPAYQVLALTKQLSTTNLATRSIIRPP